MDFLNPLFLIPALTGPILILTGFILKKYPPREINSLYGYRTKSSMKTQDRWDFAQQFSSKEMMALGGILTLSCILGIFIQPSEIIGTAIGIGFMLLVFILLMIRTERAIKSTFEKD